MATFTKVKLKVGSPKNQCPTCGELFNSISSFDFHRTGKFGIPDPDKIGCYLKADRRCLSTNEMTKKGMAKNNDGWWMEKSSIYGVSSAD